MIKPEHLTLPRLQKLLKRACYTSKESAGGWLTVTDGVPCAVNIRADSARQFIRFYTWFGLPHLDESEIAAAACRLNADFFLVRFIVSERKLSMSYDLPYSEGLKSITFIRLLRRFTMISADAFATLPKAVADRAPVEPSIVQRLH